MASNSAASKHLSPQLVELVDVAIFSFASLSGLQSTQKVCGDPVIDGVCAMFGSLLRCASDEVKGQFDEVSPVRLGGWRPGQEPSKELSTFVSSRLKSAKEKQDIREYDEPCSPPILWHTKETYIEAENRVVTVLHPRCWRCATRCRYCRMRQNKIVRSLKSE